jgi:hypothetical protein
VEVQPDPKIDLTPAEWQAREAFLVDLLQMQQEAWDAAESMTSLSDSLRSRRDAMEEAGDLTDAFAARVDSVDALADRLRDVRGDLYGLASAFNTSGVTQPTLHPPTATQRQRRSELRADLQNALQEMNALMEQE